MSDPNLREARELLALAKAGASWAAQDLFAKFPDLSLVIDTKAKRMRRSIPRADIVQVPQVAKRMGVTDKAVYARVERGAAPECIEGLRHVWDWADWERLLKKGRKK